MSDEEKRVEARTYANGRVEKMVEASRQGYTNEEMLYRDSAKERKRLLEDHPNLPPADVKKLCDKKAKEQAERRLANRIAHGKSMEGKKQKKRKPLTGQRKVTKLRLNKKHKETASAQKKVKWKCKKVTKSVTKLLVNRAVKIVKFGHPSTRINFPLMAQMTCMTQVGKILFMRMPMTRSMEERRK